MHWSEGVDAHFIRLVSEDLRTFSWFRDIRTFWILAGNKSQPFRQLLREDKQKPKVQNNKKPKVQNKKRQSNVTKLAKEKVSSKES